MRSGTIAVAVTLVASLVFGQQPQQQQQEEIPVLRPVVRTGQDVPVEPTAPPVPQGAAEQTRTPRLGVEEVVTGPTDRVDGTNGDVVLNSPAPYGTSGVLLRPGTSFPDASVKLGAAGTASRFTVFNASDVSLLNVRGDGNVGIGTASPGALLHLARNGIGVTALQISNAEPGSSTAVAMAGLRFYEGDTILKSYIHSVGTGATTAYGGASALQIWNTQPANIVFGTSNVERVRIDNAGNVLIGAAPPVSRLVSIRSEAAGTGTITAHHYPVYAANATSNDNSFSAYALPNVSSGVSNGGYSLAVRAMTSLLGAGTLTTAYGSHAAVGVSSSGTISNAIGSYVEVKKNAGAISSGTGVHIADVDGVTDYAIYAAGADDTTFLAGDVRIGGTIANNADRVQIVGNLKVSGTISAQQVLNPVFQDIAEWVPATENMPAGTVVILNPGRTNEVMPSTQAYDTSVAGVVSAQPGIVLGEETASKERVATYGRVKVRVDATAAPIRIGDLLVTGHKSGMAMKSEPMEINGRRFHQPGTIIGKALEPLEAGEGEILVLLSLQ